MKKINLNNNQIKELKSIMKNYALSSAKEYEDLKKKLNSAQKKSQKEKYKKELHAPYNSFSNNEKDVNRFLEILDVDYCPYCNINDVIAVFGGEGKRICRPDLDHFEPQSRHPEKQVTYDNLVPSCLLCNQRLKREKNFSNKKYLNPYKLDFDSIMEFKLILKGVDYLNEDNFEVEIHPRSNAKKDDVRRARKNVKVFALERRYKLYNKEIVPILRNIALYENIYKKKEIMKILNSVTPLPFRSILFPDENCEINKTRLGKLKNDVLKKFLK